MLRIAVGPFAHIPEKHFAFGAIFQRDQAEIEECEQFFAMLESVVIVLAIILNRDGLAQVAQLNHDLRIVFVDFNRRDVFDHRLDFLEHVGHQNRVISGKKTAGFLNNRRMRDVFIFADLFDRVDDVVGELLRVVVCGRVKCRLRAIVVNRHAAANVQQVDWDFHLINLGIDARGFLHGVLDALDICQLRSNVKVQQPQHFSPIGFFQTIDHFQQLGGGESELGRFAAGFFPASGTLRIKFHPHADDRQVAFGGISINSSSLKPLSTSKLSGDCSSASAA